jgi:iron complex transport system permease protein
VRLAAAVVAVLLAAVAVSTCGPVAFVALVAGPLGRRIVGGGGAALVPAALTGAVLLVSADLAGRLALAPIQLPAGLFTALLGAPYLLWLLAVQIRKGTL